MIVYRKGWLGGGDRRDSFQWMPPFVTFAQRVSWSDMGRTHSAVEDWIDWPC